MQACASRMTAPSMQPPETEPCISPASSTISMLPAGRGEEPQVETTVATAAFSARQAPRRQLLEQPLVAVHHDQLPSRAAATHSLRPSARRLPSRRQDRGQLAQAAQAVGRAEIVDMPDHRPGTRRDGRVGVEPQQRVEPDQSPAALVQPLHLRGETLAGIAVEPVADDQHHRTLAQYPARPHTVERLQARTDPRPSGPVLDGLADPGQRQVDVAVAQVAGDVGQARAEQERVHPVAVAGDRVHEQEQHARVAAHRAARCRIG